MTMTSNHRWRPSGGFMLLCLTYAGLVGLLAWGFATPDLDRVWTLYHELRIGRRPPLSHNDWQLLRRTVEEQPDLARRTDRRPASGSTERSPRWLADWLQGGPSAQARCLAVNRPRCTASTRRVTRHGRNRGARLETRAGADAEGALHSGPSVDARASRVDPTPPAGGDAGTVARGCRRAADTGGRPSALTLRAWRRQAPNDARCGRSATLSLSMEENR
jgi:hypothetical protein